MGSDSPQAPGRASGSDNSQNCGAFVSKPAWTLCKVPYSSRFFLTPHDTKGSLAINGPMSHFIHSFTYQSKKYLNVRVSGIPCKQGRYALLLGRSVSSRVGHSTQYTQPDSRLTSTSPDLLCAKQRTFQFDNSSTDACLELRRKKIEKRGLFIPSQIIASW